MKHIIPVQKNNSPPFNNLELGIQDDTSEADNRTVTFFVRDSDVEYDYHGIYTTVKASDLIKALEWLKSWA